MSVKFDHTLSLDRVFANDIDAKPIVNKQELESFVSKHRTSWGEILYLGSHKQYVQWESVGLGLFRVYLVSKEVNYYY